MSTKLISLDLLKKFADNVKDFLKAKSKNTTSNTFSLSLQLPCYQTVTGYASSGSNFLNSIICLGKSSGEVYGVIVNNGNIQITKVESSNTDIFKFTLSESCSYIISSAEINNNDPDKCVQLSKVQLVDNRATTSSTQSEVKFIIEDADGTNMGYPNNTTFTSIKNAGTANKLTHKIKFTLADSGVATDGYDLSGNDVLIQSSADSTVASADTLGKIKLGYTLNGNKRPVQLDDSNRAYVELPSSIFCYKGFVASFDKLPTNATVGDVYTVTSGTDQNDTGSEYVYVEKDGKNYWEYLGQKFSFTQERVDWEATDGVTSILNKPTIPKVSFVQYTINEQNKETPITLGEVGLNNTNEAQENTVLFYNLTEDEVTLTLDTSITWINMGGLEITIPAGKYAEFVFTYWPLETKEGEALKYIITYNGAVQQ